MKKKRLKARTLSLFLALAILVGLLPAGLLATPALAADAASTSVVDAHYSDDPDAYEIYPVPHSVKLAEAAAFTLTTDVNVVVGEGVDSYTTDFLEDILTRFGHTMTTSGAVADGKSNIVLAIHGDSDPITPAAYADLFTAEDKYDPYLLRAEASSGNQNGVITIIGKNADCVYYGVTTLQMMFTSFNGEKFLPVQIEDYSNTIFRGFVEGFYGPGFRSYADRESQMRAIRDVKGNMYVFAAKGDPYHGNQWSTPYPTDELNQIAHLVEVGKETKVNYTWSVHIGKGHALDGIDNGSAIDETLYGQRLELLKTKFQQLYDVGVRSFNVLNDDYNSGTYRVQVKLLNDVNAWLKEKGDCMPLIYCCAGYNTAWAGNGAELQALQELDDDIYLYWTGSDVNSPITQANIDWPTERAAQPIVTWLNYPCSEHAGGRGIFLGNISHYVKDANGLTGQYGLLSNGMASPEANKVAYFQLFSWCWNRDNYTDYLEELWEDCFKYLQPEVYESYLTIARNVSNCPNSGRIPNGFPESEYIKDQLAAVQTALLAGSSLDDIPEAQTLLDEFSNILAAIADFRANCENETLKAELEPWLKSLADVATAAINGMEAADALAEDDVSGAWNAFSEGAVALGKWNSYPSSNPDVSNNVKAGSLRLQPFANAVLDYVEEAMAQQFNPGGGLGDAQSFYAVLHGVKRKDDTNSAKMFDGSATTYASYHDGTGGQQQLGDYYGVDLGAVKVISAVDILQGSSDTDNDYFHVAALECSTDGENWSTLVTKVNSRHIHVEDLSVSTRYVRLRLLQKGYGGKSDYWTHIREFTVTEKEELLYTNADNAEAQEESRGGTHTLTITSATLANGEYVGIRLPELTGIQTITTAGTLPAGVTLEWSVNGEAWTQGAPSQTTLMGYVRLRATAAVTLEDVTLTAGGPVKTELSFVSSNIGVYSGAWANVVDGDRSTLVHTNTKQEYGQYAIFDLSGTQPVHDVTVWIPESGNDIPHNLDIYVGDSADLDGNWELIAELRDNHYDMAIPYRYFSCDGGGAKVGRYIKLAVANIEAANWIKINELEVNTTVSQQEPPKAVAATSGNAGDAVDGNLLTFFAPDSGTSGTWTKLLQAPATYTGVTVLRGVEGAAATVEVEKNNAWTQVGALTDSATTISLSEVGAITGLRISWAAGDAPAIAEVIFAGEAASGGTVPAPAVNIYEQPTSPAGVSVDNGTALAEVGLPATVSVTTSAGETATVPVAWSCEDYNATATGDYTFIGTFPETFNPGCFTLTATVTVRAAEIVPPEGDNLALNGAAYASGQETAGNSPDKAVDGNSSDASRWNSNYMKVNADNPAWLVVDLGENVASITGVTMRFHNLVWPTNYKVQVAGSGFTPVDYSETNGAGGGTLNADTFAGNNAENAACWTTIKTISNASYSAHPTVTISSGDFDAAVPAGTRYLRLYFTGINTAAAGHCVSLWELTVTGSRDPSLATPTVVGVTLSPSAVSAQAGTPFAQLGLPTQATAQLSDGTTASGAITWDESSYDPDQTGTQTVTGTIALSNGLTAAVSISVTVSAAPATATVTFVTNGGSSLAAQAVEIGSAVARPTDPTKDGFTFSGWYTDAALTQAYDFATLLTGDLTLYAAWTPIATEPVSVTGVTLNKTTATVKVGSALQLTATVAPSNADNKAVTWASDNADVAAVDQSGKVTGVAEGETAITVTTADGGFTATCQVTVTKASSGNTPSTPSTPSEPVTEPTDKTEIKENEDGSVTTTETKPDGTVIETTEKPDGTKEVVKTQPDGTVMEIVVAPDGTKESMMTRPDGTVTETVEKPDGTKVEKVTDPEENVTIVATDAEGEKLAEVVIPAVIPEPETRFEDVPEGHWADEAIHKLATIEVVNGVGGNQYDMEGDMTRGALATVLHRLSNKPEVGEFSFDDVDNDAYYAEGVAWAEKTGVVKGFSAAEFRPEQTITREQLALMLMRYAKLLGMDITADTEALESFADGADTHDWAAEGVAWCVQNGILQGKGGSKLDPTANVTRAQVAVMVDRFVKLMK